MAARPPAFEGHGYYADSALERPLPHAPEAEKILCGAPFVNPANLDRIREKLSPGMFFLPETRLIHMTQVALREKGLPFDEASVIDELKRQDKLDAAGGAGFIASLADGIPKILNLDGYIESVARTWRARTLAHSAEALLNAALRGQDEEIETCLAALQRDSLTSAKPALRAVSADVFLQMNIPPREMLLDPIVPTQGLVMLYSKRGVGKTYLALAAAYAVSTGSKCLNWSAPKPRGVLYVDGELPASVLRERLAAVKEGWECTTAENAQLLNLITPDLQDAPMPDLSTQSGQAQIEAHLEGVALLILDNLSALCTSGKENEGESWLPMQGWFLRLRQRGISVLFIHHAGKSGAQRGSSRREDLLDTTISLRHPSDYAPEQGMRFEVHIEKGRSLYGDSAKPFEVRLETNPQGAAVWTTRALEDSIAQRAAEMFEDGLKVREVAEELGISKSRAGRLRSKAKRD